MDTNDQQPMTHPQQPGAPTPEVPATEAGHDKEPVLIGIVIAIAIILLILFIGALYLWVSRQAADEAPQLAGEEAMMEDDQQTQAPAGSASAEERALDELSTELDTELTGIDGDLSELDAALEADVQ